MKIGDLDTEREVLIIAEVGNNHEGNFSLAEDMVGMAAEAGVGAVKFQTFRPEEYVSRSDEARFKRLKGFEFSQEQFRSLSVTARKAGLVFLSTPFDLGSADFLSGIAPAFKIGSGENTFYPLLERAASYGKPIIMSCGISDLPEIQYSKSLIEKTWRQRAVSPGLAVLHCVSSYPTPPEQANLLAIRTLIEQLDCVVGYSDHTLGIEAAVASVALGARIVEKHFTVDKDYSDFRDHKLSADPKEMRALVDRVRELSAMLGTGEKKLAKAEESSLVAMRRSIVAKADLKSGHALSMVDLTWVRPGGGLAPGSESAILGRTLKRDVSAGSQLALDMFE